MTGPKTYEVDPQRLASGRWCHKRNRYVGEGDIAASYSADRISRGTSVKTFHHHGVLWVAVGSCTLTIEAYRLVHPTQFTGPTCTYLERVEYGRRTKSNPPEGFYHGMRVRYRGQDMVMCGTAAQFVEGEPEQGSLF